MANVKPFKALRFTKKAGDIAQLVCPPYDIISEEEYNVWFLWLGRAASCHGCEGAHSRKD